MTYDNLFRLIEYQKITSTSLTRQANISDNIISRLRRNEYVSLETIENICRVSDCQVNDILEFRRYDQQKNESPLKNSSVRADIQNRRYLGNKFKLLEFIKSIVQENCSEIETYIKSEDSVVLQRSGTINSKILIEKNNRNNCFYSTPMGDLTIGVYGEVIEHNLSENGGEVKLKYTIDSDLKLISRNEVNISVREVK